MEEDEGSTPNMQQALKSIERIKNFVDRSVSSPKNQKDFQKLKQILLNELENLSNLDQKNFEVTQSYLILIKSLQNAPIQSYGTVGISCEFQELMIGYLPSICDSSALNIILDNLIPIAEENVRIYPLIVFSIIKLLRQSESNSLEQITEFSNSPFFSGAHPSTITTKFFEVTPVNETQQKKDNLNMPDLFEKIRKQAELDLVEKLEQNRNKTDNEEEKGSTRFFQKFLDFAFTGLDCISTDDIPIIINSLLMLTDMILKKSDIPNKSDNIQKNKTKKLNNETENKKIAFQIFEKIKVSIVKLMNDLEKQFLEVFLEPKNQNEDAKEEEETADEALHEKQRFLAENEETLLEISKKKIIFSSILGCFEYFLNCNNSNLEFFLEFFKPKLFGSKIGPELDEIPLKITWLKQMDDAETNPKKKTKQKTAFLNNMIIQMGNFNFERFCLSCLLFSNLGNSRSSFFSQNLKIIEELIISPLFTSVSCEKDSNSIENIQNSPMFTLKFLCSCVQFLQFLNVEYFIEYISQDNQDSLIFFEEDTKKFAPFRSRFSSSPEEPKIEERIGESLSQILKNLETEIMNGKRDLREWNHKTVQLIIFFFLKSLQILPKDIKKRTISFLFMHYVQIASSSRNSNLSFTDFPKTKNSSKIHPEFLGNDIILDLLKNIVLFFPEYDYSFFYEAATHSSHPSITSRAITQSNLNRNSMISHSLFFMNSINSGTGQNRIRSQLISIQKMMNTISSPAQKFIFSKKSDPFREKNQKTERENSAFSHFSSEDSGNFQENSKLILGLKICHQILNKNNHCLGDEHDFKTFLPLEVKDAFVLLLDTKNEDTKKILDFSEFDEISFDKMLCVFYFLDFLESRLNQLEQLRENGDFLLEIPIEPELDILLKLNEELLDTIYENLQLIVPADEEKTERLDFTKICEMFTEELKIIMISTENSRKANKNSSSFCQKQDHERETFFIMKKMNRFKLFVQNFINFFHSKKRLAFMKHSKSVDRYNDSKFFLDFFVLLDNSCQSLASTTVSNKDYLFSQNIMTMLRIIAHVQLINSIPFSTHEHSFSLQGKVSYITNQIFHEYHSLLPIYSSNSSAMEIEIIEKEKNWNIEIDKLIAEIASQNIKFVLQSVNLSFKCLPPILNDSEIFQTKILSTDVEEIQEFKERLSFYGLLHKFIVHAVLESFRSTKIWSSILEYSSDEFQAIASNTFAKNSKISVRFEEMQRLLDDLFSIHASENKQSAPNLHLSQFCSLLIKFLIEGVLKFEIDLYGMEEQKDPQFDKIEKQKLLNSFYRLLLEIFGILRVISSQNVVYLPMLNKRNGVRLKKHDLHSEIAEIFNNMTQENQARKSLLQIEHPLFENSPNFFVILQESTRKMLENQKAFNILHILHINELLEESSQFFENSEKSRNLSQISKNFAGILVNIVQKILGSDSSKEELEEIENFFQKHKKLTLSHQVETKSRSKNLSETDLQIQKQEQKTINQNFFSFLSQKITEDGSTEEKEEKETNSSRFGQTFETLIFQTQQNENFESEKLNFLREISTKDFNSKANPDFNWDLLAFAHILHSSLRVFGIQDTAALIIQISEAIDLKICSDNSQSELQDIVNEQTINVVKSILSVLRYSIERFSIFDLNSARKTSTSKISTFQLALKQYNLFFYKLLQSYQKNITILENLKKENGRNDTKMTQSNTQEDFETPRKKRRRSIQNFRRKKEIETALKDFQQISELNFKYLRDEISSFLRTFESNFFSILQNRNLFSEWTSEEDENLELILQAFALNFNIFSTFEENIFNSLSLFTIVDENEGKKPAKSKKNQIPDLSNQRFLYRKLEGKLMEAAQRLDLEFDSKQALDGDSSVNEVLVQSILMENTKNIKKNKKQEEEEEEEDEEIIGDEEDEESIGDEEDEKIIGDEEDEEIIDDGEVAEMIDDEEDEEMIDDEENEKIIDDKKVEQKIDDEEDEVIIDDIFD